MAEEYRMMHERFGMTEEMKGSEGKMKLKLKMLRKKRKDHVTERREATATAQTTQLNSTQHSVLLTNIQCAVFTRTEQSTQILKLPGQANCKDSSRRVSASLPGLFEA